MDLWRSLWKLLSYNLCSQVERPRNEDIECLCKLMATIGSQLEASAKAKVHIDAYCNRMEEIRDLRHLEVSPLPIRSTWQSLPCSGMVLDVRPEQL